MNLPATIDKLPAKLDAGLTQTEKLCVISSLSRKVAEIEPKEVCEKLFEIIKLAYFDTGTKMPEDVSTEFSAMAKSWYSAIMIDQKYTSLEEIGLAVKMGASGKFKDSLNREFGKVSIEWLMGCIEQYKRLPERTKAISEYSKAIREQKKQELSEENLDEIFEQSYQTCIEHVKAGKDINLLDPGNSVARKLWPKLNQAKWPEYMRTATDMINQHHEIELKKAKDDNNRIEVKKIMAEMSELFDSDRPVKSLAARLALREYILTTNKW